MQVYFGKNWKKGGWGLGVENLIKINMSCKISEPNIFLEFSSIFFLRQIFYTFLRTNKTEDFDNDDHNDTLYYPYSHS